MKVQTRCGRRRPKGHRSEAYPFEDSIKQLDAAATASLRRFNVYGNRDKFIHRGGRS
jgi:hypothetical protein